MEEKLVDYFDAGVELVWLVDVQNRTIEVFEAPDASVILRADQTVSGGAVLPGFRLRVGELFNELEER